MRGGGRVASARQRRCRVGMLFGQRLVVVLLLRLLDISMVQERRYDGRGLELRLLEAR